MPDRSFMEFWSLDFDDAGFVEGFNLDSRIRVAFQLRFFRTHGRFPSRGDDPCREGVQYLGQQLDVTVPPCARGSSKAAGVRVRPWRNRLHPDMHGASPIPSMSLDPEVKADKIMERLVRGARHDLLEGFLTSIVRCLPTGTRTKLDESLSEPRGPVCSFGPFMPVSQRALILAKRFQRPQQAVQRPLSAFTPIRTGSPISELSRHSKSKTTLDQHGGRAPCLLPCWGIAHRAVLVQKIDGTKQRAITC